MSVKTAQTFIGHPTIDACHSRDFQHSGYILQQITVILDIGPEIRLLDRGYAGTKLVKSKLQDFFTHFYRPAAKDKTELFLPSKFTPYEVLAAAQNLSEGKKAYTDAEKFVQDHEGFVIVAVTDVYFLRQESSWAAQCWVLDCDHPGNNGFDYLIQQNLDEDVCTDSIENVACYETSDTKSFEQLADEKNETIFYEDSDGLVGYCEPGEKYLTEQLSYDKDEKNPYRGIQKK